MNKYLEKVAMQTDKSNPVFQKMTAQVDARRAEKEAAKDAELTPAQKRIKEKQEAAAQKPAADPTPDRKAGVQASHEKARGILQAQKAERHAQFEQGNQYLDRAQRESHTPPNAAGQVERIQTGDSMPPLRPNQELVHFQEPPAGHIHTSQTVEGFGQRLRNALARRGTLKGIALGGAALAAAGGAGYAAGHSKAAEREGNADYDVDTSATTDAVSNTHAADIYKHYSGRLNGGAMYISGGGNNYRYHPTTGLQKLKRLEWSQEKAAEKEENFQPVNPAHKGLLHEEMGIPQGEPISEEKLRHVIATTNNEHTRRRAQFALNARKWKH